VEYLEYKHQPVNAIYWMAQFKRYNLVTFTYYILLYHPGVYYQSKAEKERNNEERIIMSEVTRVSQINTQAAESCE
jgi:hypothetical protein